VFQPKAGFHPKDAWFRSGDWDAKAQAEFETRLARATAAKRAQYRRIKAIALLDSGNAQKVAAGRELLLSNVRDGDVHQFERVSALSILGSHLHDAGQSDEAERYLRQVLDVSRSNQSGTNGLEAIRLAEILLMRGGPDELSEAHNLLEQVTDDPPIFVASRFRMALAATRVALARGQSTNAIEWAQAALVYADAKHSGLANHPALLLAKVDRGTRKWLESVAAGNQTRDIHQR